MSDPFSRQSDSPSVRKTPQVPRPSSRRMFPVANVASDSSGPHDRPTPRSTVIPRLPQEPDAIRPRMPTLIFHGAPPLPASRKPPPPIPKAPTTRPEGLDDHVAFDLRSHRDSSSMRISSAELIEERASLANTTSLENTGAIGDDGRETPAFEPHCGAPFARSERPPALDAMPPMRGPWRGALVVAACVMGFVGCFFVAKSMRDAWTAKSNASAANAANAQGGVAPKAAAVPPGTCTVSGATRTVARRALVKGGVEATSLDARLGFAVVTGPKEGAAFELDAASLTVTSTTRILAADPVRRVVPALSGNMPLDAEVDPNALRVVSDPDGDAVIGARGGYVVWGGRDGESQTKLWKLDGAKEIEAPRVIAIGASGERVVAFRHESAIWVGAFRASDVNPSLGAMVRISDGLQVGSPSIDARGDDVIVAWAQRDSKTSAWGVRWTRWRSGGEAEKPRSLVIPAGGPGGRAIAPSVAALDGGRFLLAWTEGASSSHQVRAQVIDELDQPRGDVLAISQPDVVAGQEQIAMARGGHGAIAYLSSRGRAFELAATPIACTGSTD